jgi:hypothetical protein
VKISTFTALAGMSVHAAGSNPTPAAGQAAIGPHLPPSMTSSVPLDVMSTREWTDLVIAIQVARHRQRYTGGALRTTVFAVVRAMRASGLSWDMVYTALTTAVAGYPGLQIVYAPDCNTHVSRSAALIAHMHAWADCERLDELERAGGEGATG